MALLLAPEIPLPGWLQALDAQIELSETSSALAMLPADHLTVEGRMLQCQQMRGERVTKRMNRDPLGRSGGNTARPVCSMQAG